MTKGNDPRIIAAEKAIGRLLARLEDEIGLEVSGVYVEAVEIGVCGAGEPQKQKHISIETRQRTGARWAITS